MIRYPHTKNKEILSINMIYLCTTLICKMYKITNLKIIWSQIKWMQHLMHLLCDLLLGAHLEFALSLLPKVVSLQIEIVNQLSVLLSLQKVFWQSWNTLMHFVKHTQQNKSNMLMWGLWWYCDAKHSFYRIIDKIYHESISYSDHLMLTATGSFKILSPRRYYHLWW